MDVAAHRDHDLLLLEGPDRLHALPRLADVELGVHRRAWMDVVQRLVAVLDLEALSHLQPHEVRLVHSAVWSSRPYPWARDRSGDAALDVDEDVLDAAVLDVDRLSLEASLCSFWLGVCRDLIFSGRGAPPKVTSRRRRPSPCGSGAGSPGGAAAKVVAGAAACRPAFSAAAGQEGEGRGERDNGEGLPHGHHMTPREEVLCVAPDGPRGNKRFSKDMLGDAVARCQGFAPTSPSRSAVTARSRRASTTRSPTMIGGRRTLRSLQSA